MAILFVLIPLAIILITVAIWAFFWAVNNKQFDDLDSPAQMVLLDDDEFELAEIKRIDTENRRQELQKLQAEISNQKKNK